MAAGSSSITIIYMALLGIGIIYAVLILIGGGLHGLHIPGFDIHLDGHDFGVGHDVDISHAEVGTNVDHPSVKVPSLSPVTIASFITAFGAFGLIALGLFDATTRGSLVWAAVGGLIMRLLLILLLDIF